MYGGDTIGSWFVMKVEIEDDDTDVSMVGSDKYYLTATKGELEYGGEGMPDDEDYDIDYDDDAIIGGWTWDETLDDDGKVDANELVEDETGIYNNGDANGKVEIEKGTGDSRSFTKELEEMVYNVGM